MQSPFTPRCHQAPVRKPKVIVDPIHGHMEFPPMLVSIIDTLYFQRLRELKQLGCADWVFPGAVHTRFIHSLGVAHLANNVMQRLKINNPHLEITERDCMLVSMAGLCHDLGHGPFSHGFERVVQIALEEEREKAADDPIKQQKIPDSWHHEQASELLFQASVEESGLDISSEEVEFVKAMIRGVGEDEKRPMDKPLFFFQVVANKQTGMDVDKYDYLLRDAMCCGAKIAFDISRLLRPEVRRNENGNLVLAYYRKEEWMIHQLFRSRFDMHHQIYGHSVVVAFTRMFEEVLLLAKDWLRVTEAITTPKLYLYLTDAVIQRIESLDINSPPKGFTEGSLRKTQKLIQRIKQRDLYTSILHDMTLKLDAEKTGKYFVEQELVKRLVEAKPELAEFTMDFIVVVADRDFTRGEQNPLLHVPFYSDRGGDSRVTYLTNEDLENSTQPARFWERFVRVYIKDRRADYAGHLNELLVKAFHLLKRTDNGPLCPTPVVPDKVISTPEKMSQEYEQRISEGGSDFGGGVGGEFHSQSSLRHSGAKKRQLFSEGGDDDYQEDEQLLASSVVKKMRFSIPDN